jgi:hypothetical protein
LDEPADAIALQPELKAIAKEIAENSQYTHLMNDKEVPSPGADQVHLIVKWQPHPMDKHGKPQESEYKMSRVSLISPAIRKVLYIICFHPPFLSTE